VRPVHALLGQFALLSAAALGCAYLSRPDNTLAPGHEGAPGVKRFLVCAPNTVISLPAELQGGGATDALREQIDAYLHFHDRDAQWLNLLDSREFWGKAAAAAKQKGTVDKTPVFFAELLDQKYDFDAIVMPSIVVHKTRAADGGAAWDGVSRQMELLNRPVRRFDGQDTFAEGVQSGGVTGEVLVTSVHVLVFSRAGERVFEGRGGFAFVHDADMTGAQKNWSWKYRIRDLAADIGALREGIAIAFDPYLPEAD
jgi:hypothetical protein